MLWICDEGLKQENFHKEYNKIVSKQSTMITKFNCYEEEDDFQKLLVLDGPRNEQLKFFSEKNSLFEIDMDDSFPIFPDLSTPLFGNDKQLFSKKKNTKNTQKQRNKKIKKTGSSCKCTNSNCLRLHCSCFKELAHCSPQCRCRNCLNKKEFSDARNFVINKTQTIYKRAFENKNIFIRGKKINKDGCNCSKGCQNNYCGCKKIEGVCSPICRCKECLNHKIDLTKEEVQRFYKPCSRKKDKIVISYGKQKQGEEKKQKIVYKTYKKQKSLCQLIYLIQYF